MLKLYLQCKCCKKRFTKNLYSPNNDFKQNISMFSHSAAEEVIRKVQNREIFLSYHDCSCTLKGVPEIVGFKLRKRRDDIVKSHKQTVWSLFQKIKRRDKHV